MNNNILKINNIYEKENYTESCIIQKNINEYIDKIYKTNLDNNSNVFFIGILEKNNYNINGNGILIKDNILIKGDIENNNFNNCKLNFIYNGCTNILFEGSIVNNDLYKGTLKYNNIKLSGEFLKGLPNNICSYNASNEMYNGSWNNGIKNGYGTYENKNYKYNGEWKNNLFDGIGTLFINNSNTIYNGSFVEGKKHGVGTLNINNETFYVEYNIGVLNKKLTLQEKENCDLKNINNKLNNKLDETKLLVQTQEDTIQTQEDTIISYNSKLLDLQKQLRKIQESILCKICFKHNSNIVLNPCSHMSICSNCVKLITNRKCPICRAIFRSYSNVFIS